jgi:hypothetical protein
MTTFFLRKNSQNIESCLTSKTTDKIIGRITSIRYSPEPGFPHFTELSSYLDRDQQREQQINQQKQMQEIKVRKDQEQKRIEKALAAQKAIDQRKYEFSLIVNLPPRHEKIIQQLEKSKKETEQRLTKLAKENSDLKSSVKEEKVKLATLLKKNSVDSDGDSASETTMMIKKYAS